MLLEDVASPNYAQSHGIEDSLAMTSAGTENVLPSVDVSTRKRKCNSSPLWTVSNNVDGRARKRRLGKDLHKQVLQASVRAHLDGKQLRNVPPLSLRCIGDPPSLSSDGTLPAFKYTKSEIEIVEAIGDAPHYKIFRAVASNQSYHLYIVRILSFSSVPL
jgi:hypothetical protein